MEQVFSYTDSIHIKEADNGIELLIDKQSEVYEWLQELKEYYETDLFYVLYDLIRSEIEDIRERV